MLHDENYCVTLTARAQIIGEGYLSSDQHTSFPVESLPVYPTVLENVRLISDNFSVNQYLEKLTIKTLIGCLRQKSNLPFEQCLKTKHNLSDVVDLLQEIIGQLRTLKNASCR